MWFNLDQFDLTVLMIECNHLKEQALKDIKIDIYDSFKGILLEFPDVFEERVCEFEGKLTLETEPDSVPLQQSIRGVLFELEKMIRDDILEKIEGSSSWLSSYVIERKLSRKLEICIKTTSAIKAYPWISYQPAKYFMQEWLRGDYLVEGYGNNSDQSINNHNQNLLAYLQKCKEKNYQNQSWQV